MKNVIIKKINKFNDARGWLAETFRNDEFSYKPVMAYVSSTKPGIVRGPHEHKKQSDFFVFIGPGDFELHLWDKKDKYLKLKAGEKNPTAVLVPPGIVHGYKCISKKDGWVINLPDKLYKGKNKKNKVDEIRWELVSNSPYKIK